VVRRAARAQYTRALAETVQQDGVRVAARRVGRRLRRWARPG
jgi:hypothetical protein